MQVQAAIAETRAGSRGREALENGHASASARSSTPRAGDPAAGISSGTATPLAEGTETALLYVRFRAAAEPGLKGEPTDTHGLQLQPMPPHQRRHLPHSL